MTSAPKVVPALFFLALFGLLVNVFMPAAALAGEEDTRTANRNIFGRIFYPERIYAKPEHDEFLIQNSNRVAHPDAWRGQDWDTRQWNAGWTPDVAVRKFFQARIFERQYMRNGQIPAVEVGPTFYKLSDLDKRRTLKLLTDYNAYFKRGYGAVALVDWSTRYIVGSYTPKGMFLN
jgi:hypothetical protein